MTALTDIPHRALAIFGHESQWQMVTEECAELIVAVSHYRRNRASADAVAEEIADVLITLEQAIEMVGPERVEAALNRKLERLRSRVESAERAREGGNDA